MKVINNLNHICLSPPDFARLSSNACAPGFLVTIFLLRKEIRSDHVISIRKRAQQISISYWKETNCYWHGLKGNVATHITTFKRSISRTLSLVVKNVIWSKGCHSKSLLGNDTSMERNVSDAEGKSCVRTLACINMTSLGYLTRASVTGRLSHNTPCHLNT